MRTPRNSADKAFLAILRVWNAVGRIVTRLYLFARLRRKHVWRTLGRKLTHLVHPRLRGMDR